MPKILITGASGAVGNLVLSQLLARTPQPLLRVSSRDPTKLNVPSSVEVVKGDLSDPSTYPALFNKVEKVFLYASGAEGKATQVAKAAKDAGVRHIVFLSSALVLEHGNYIGEMHLRVENAIKDAGFTYTFLRAGGFAANAILMWAPQIKYTNKVLQPYLDSHSSPLANEDTATIAVTALTSSSLDNKAPILTGPRNITYREHLEAISKVRQETKGEPLKFEEVSGERWKEAMAGKVPTELADSLLDLWSKGVSAPYPVSHDFEQVTGKPGMEFVDWVKLHKDELF